METSTMNSEQTEKLMTDLKTLARDAEELLRATGGDLSEKAKEARSRLSQTLEQAKDSCRSLEGKLRDGARDADQLVRQHPYESIGLAVGVGLIVGLLCTRK